MATYTDLPPDVLRQTYRNSSIHDLFSICRTSTKSARAICDSDTFWQDLFRRRLSSDAPFPAEGRNYIKRELWKAENQNRKQTRYLVDVVKKGYDIILPKVLAYEEWDESDLSQALRSAAQTGNVPMFRMVYDYFLEHLPDYIDSDEMLPELAGDAGYHGHDSMIEFLLSLSSSADYSDRVYGNALIGATESGNLAYVQKYAVKPMSQAWVDDAFWIALDHGRLEIANYLLKGNISRYYLVMGIAKASKLNDIRLVNEIIELIPDLTEAEIDRILDSNRNDIVYDLFCARASQRARDRAAITAGNISQFRACEQAGISDNTYDETYRSTAPHPDRSDLRNYVYPHLTNTSKTLMETLWLSKNYKAPDVYKDTLRKIQGLPDRQMIIDEAALYISSITPEFRDMVSESGLETLFWADSLYDQSKFRELIDDYILDEFQRKRLKLVGYNKAMAILQSRRTPREIRNVFIQACHSLTYKIIKLLAAVVDDQTRNEGFIHMVQNADGDSEAVRELFDLVSPETRQKALEDPMLEEATRALLERLIDNPEHILMD